MIKFVSFYQKIVNHKSVKLKNRLTLQSFTYEKCLTYLHETFKKFNPNHKYIIATDTHTDLPNITDIVVRDNLDNLLIMEAITRSNTNFILKNTGKIILAGADHLVCGPVDDFFQEEFDLGFWIFPTYDPFHRISVSMTVVLINKNETNNDKINEFFLEREKICFSLEKKEKQWYADQKSLSLLLDRENIIKEYHDLKGEKTLFDFNGLKIKFFPYYEKKYLTDVESNGHVDINPESILIDFPGHQSKEFIDSVYKKVVEMS